MSENQTKICNNCGAVCNIYDTYCKKCSNSFDAQTMSNEQIIDGIDDNDVKDFIEKNADYYEKKIRKSKNKKWFIQLNFAALLFGPTWFFYRKMYKFAVIYATILIVLSSALSIILPLTFKNSIDEYYFAKNEYSNYINSGGEILVFEEGTIAVSGTNPSYKILRDNLNDAKNKIKLITVLINVPVLVVNVLFRLFGNAFYKKYIIENMNSSNGGVSMKFAILGLIVVNIISLSVSLIALQIPAVSDFAYASQNYWIY